MRKTAIAAAMTGVAYLHDSASISYGSRLIVLRYSRPLWSQVYDVPQSKSMKTLSHERSTFSASRRRRAL